MIKLYVEDYCHNCPMFKTRTERAEGTYLYKITCENSGRCKTIVAYLLDELKKEKETNDQSSGVSGTVRG